MICGGGDDDGDIVTVLNTGPDNINIGDRVQWQPSRKDSNPNRPRRTYNLFAIEDWKEATFRTLVYMELLRLAKAEAHHLSVEVLVEHTLPGRERKRADIMLKAWSVIATLTERRDTQHLLGVSVLELKCSGLADLSRNYYAKRVHTPDYAFPGIRQWKPYRDLSYKEKVDTWFPAATYAFLEKVPDATKIRLIIKGAARTYSSATVQELMQKTCDEQLVCYAQLATMTHYRDTHHAVLHLMFSHIFHQTIHYTRTSAFTRIATRIPIHTATTAGTSTTKAEAGARGYDAVNTECVRQIDPRTAGSSPLMPKAETATEVGGEARSTPGDSDDTDSLTGHIQNLALVHTEKDVGTENVEEKSDC
jgi:hypothetical protein